MQGGVGLSFDSAVGHWRGPKKNLAGERTEVTGVKRGAQNETKTSDQIEKEPMTALQNCTTTLYE